MKSLLLHTLFITSSCITPLLAQEEANESTFIKDTISRTKMIDAVNNRFSNLPKEQREKYITLKQDTYRYFNNKRTFEALLALSKMLEIFDEDPQVYNLLGSIHIEFRNFPKARETFERALDIAVGDTMLIFNLAEIEFCSSNWKQALQRFQQVQREDEEKGSELTNLIDLKMMLCHLALSKESNKQTNESQKAAHLADAKKFITLHSYLDDTPYYYYVNAAMAFHNDDTLTAKKFIRSAQAVFANKPGSLSSWKDTFIEYGFIASHYGIDTVTEEETPANIAE